MDETMTDVESRCRLMLIAPQMEDVDECARAVGDALRGGDVASVIIAQFNLDDVAFQKYAESLVPVVQAAGAAAIIFGDSRVAGRVKADGLHIEGPPAVVEEAVEKYAPKMIVGAGHVGDRHKALELGEAQPDYVFFGKVGGDIKPEPHPKNLDLAEWWASMIEIPCIVMGGSDAGSALTVAETGAEFVALGKAVFAEPEQAASIVASTNALLDEKAPRFEA
jgi:thiamine-phosphate pyrophosphorylase